MHENENFMRDLSLNAVINWLNDIQMAISQSVSLNQWKWNWLKCKNHLELLCIYLLCCNFTECNTMTITAAARFMSDCYLWELSVHFSDFSAINFLL